MKKLVGIFLLLLLSLTIATPVSAQNDIIVRKHHINLLVNADGKYQFTHTLDVEFLAPYRGIYVNIPQQYNMNWEIDGEIINRTYIFPLSNITVYDDNHLITRSKEGIQIRIGDEDKFITGLKKYTYSYTMKTTDLRLNGEQLFYLNLIGDQWEIPTELVEFTITFHKNIQGLNPQFYTGFFGEGESSGITFEVSQNIIKGVSTVSLNPYEALTIYLDVPNDFFEFKPEFDFSWLTLLFAILMSGLTIFLFFKYGKDEPAIPIIQFQAPKGLSSAQVGYIYDGSVDNKDLLSLIIYWAANGFLTIEELSKDNILLTKVKDLPENTITAEKSLFNELFKTDDLVTTDSLKYKFHAALSVARTNLERYFTTNKQRRVYSQKANAIQAVLALTLPSIVALITFVSVYQNTYYIIEALIAAGITWMFGIIVKVVTLVASKNIHTYKAFRKIIRIASVSAVILVYSIVVYFINAAYEGSWISVLILLLFIMSTGFNAFMHKRTDVGLSWYNDILGLKNFIELAEKDRLEMLVHEDPEYFYHILPYAYVLNVTNVWSKKFENIAMDPPSWYVGPQPLNSVIFYRSLTRSLNTMSKTMMAPPPTKSGKGGGSVGGGGGFSGGGFGGGGGGGW